MNDGNVPNLGTPNDDKASILTHDKLKKFNDINGSEHGPEIEIESENRDQVNELAASPSKIKSKALNGKSVIKS